jgi:hypothetical protein
VTDDAKPSLQAQIDQLVLENDTQAMCALYRSYERAALVFGAAANEPRGEGVDIFDAETEQAWANAYLVAEHLKRMQPDAGYHVEEVGSVLFDCSIAHGKSLGEAIAAAQAVLNATTGHLPPGCHAAVIADQFSKATELFDAVDGDERPCSDYSKSAYLGTLTDRSEFLKVAASHERATSIKGALFQIAVVASLVDNALHSTEWREAMSGLAPDEPYNLPETIRDRERQIYRLLQSGVTAIAHACGIPPKEYCGDQFLNIDPFEDMGV